MEQGINIRCQKNQIWVRCPSVALGPLTEEAIALAAEVDLDFALQVECNLEIRN